jgi:hypothetical protein
VVVEAFEGEVMSTRGEHLSVHSVRSRNWMVCILERFIVVTYLMCKVEME